MTDEDGQKKTRTLTSELLDRVQTDTAKLHTTVLVTQRQYTANILVLNLVQRHFARKALRCVTFERNFSISQYLMLATYP